MSKILIAENHVDITELLSLVIVRNGFEVATALNKSTLLKKLEIFSPDMILLNIMLGKENGRDICEEIKKKYPHIFIILLSANPELLKDFELCNADDIIEKPFDIHEVVDKIKKIFS